MAAAYRAQVDLLLRILPYVAQESCFALKGGTAINLFVRAMPRFSVDLDLTYLPNDDRDVALRAIASALGRIKQRLETALPGIVISSRRPTAAGDASLICTFSRATVKVEVNTVIRGQLWPARTMEIAPAVQEAFAKSAVIAVVSAGELFGGKICAALDRQHPRDLFDVRGLLAEEGLTEEIRLGFIALLLSHTRPPHELLDPSIQDQQTLFETQFAGMTNQAFTYADFETTRQELVQEIRRALTPQDREFLLGFVSGAPDWSRFPLLELQALPAVRWKLLNLGRLRATNPTKHAEQLRLLAAVLQS